MRQRTIGTAFLLPSILPGKFPYPEVTLSCRLLSSDNNCRPVYWLCVAYHLCVWAEHISRVGELIGRIGGRGTVWSDDGDIDGSAARWDGRRDLGVGNT
jgi:hypothetical protein